MSDRTDIEFPVGNGGISIRGWFYPAQNAGANERPCIIMTHGFSALKEHGLEKFAHVFTEAGFCVLAYDNRNFGESGGYPRHEVDPSLQISDMSSAITYAQSRKEVQQDAIGLWGTSFSGGNVLVVAASDKRVKCVVAQVPFVSGHHKQLRLTKPEKWKEIKKMYEEDRNSCDRGLQPKMVPVVTEDQSNPGIIKQVSAYQFFTSVAKWKNEVTLRSLENSGEYEPINYIHKISPVPLLFIVAKNDTVNTTELALKAFKIALPPKDIILIDGDHFAPYETQFSICSKAACEWFTQVLIEKNITPSLHNSALHMEE